jgi:hypothetical protein
MLYDDILEYFWTNQYGLFYWLATWPLIIVVYIYLSSLLFPDLLWVAPEHLRTDPYSDISLPGDVYGFGIILYEVLTMADLFDEDIQTAGLEGEYHQTAGLEGEYQVWCYSDIHIQSLPYINSGSH